MAAITYTQKGDITEGIKIKVIDASVTATSNTITVADMTTVLDVRATASGTPGTLKACTFSTNVITTDGHITGTETWRLIVFGY
jgi:hypothetical protein